MNAYSAPYIIGEYKYLQPNGISFFVQKYGDEFGIYECSDNGLVVKNKNDNYYYYGFFAEGAKILPSNIKVGIDNEERKSEIQSIQKDNYTYWKKISKSSQFKPSVAKIASGNVPDSLIVLLVQFTNTKHRGGYTKTHIFNSFFKMDMQVPVIILQTERRYMEVYETILKICQLQDQGEAGS